MNTFPIRWHEVHDDMSEHFKLSFYLNTFKVIIKCVCAWTVRYIKGKYILLVYMKTMEHFSTFLRTTPQCQWIRRKFLCTFYIALTCCKAQSPSPSLLTFPIFPWSTSSSSFHHIRANTLRWRQTRMVRLLENARSFPCSNRLLRLTIKF